MFHEVPIPCYTLLQQSPWLVSIAPCPEHAMLCVACSHSWTCLAVCLLLHRPPCCLSEVGWHQCCACRMCCRLNTMTDVQMERRIKNILNVGKVSQLTHANSWGCAHMCTQVHICACILSTHAFLTSSATCEQFCSVPLTRAHTHPFKSPNCHKKRLEWTSIDAGQSKR